MRKNRSLPIREQGSICADKAWLLGFIAGDGHVQIEADHSSKVVASCGLDRELARTVSALIEKLYDVPRKVRSQDMSKWERKTNHSAMCYRREVALDVLSYSPTDTRNWKIPAEVLESTPEVRGAWLSGLADAEGTVAYSRERSSRYIAISSTNMLGLEAARRMLEEVLGTRVSWNSQKKPGCSTEHKILVTNRRSLTLFNEKVGFRSRRKAEKLRAALESYERDTLPQTEVEALLPEIQRRRAEGQEYKQIAVDMNLTYEKVRGALKRRGLTGSRVGKKSKHEHLVPEIVKRAAGGEKYVQIAEALGMTVDQVFGALKRRGLTKRRSEGGGSS